MRIVKRITMVLSAAVIVIIACFSVVGCGNDELMQKIDALTEKVGTLGAENASLTEKLGNLQSENEELSEKFDKAEEEHREHLLETAYQNMFTFDLWRRTSGIKNNRITFNHPDPEITFECTVENGMICFYDDYGYIPDIYAKKLTCCSGDEISWSFSNLVVWDFIDIIIKKNEVIVGYAIIDIAAVTDVNYMLFYKPNILTSYAPYIKGGYMAWIPEVSIQLAMSEAKATVAERNKKITELFEERLNNN